MATLTAKAWKEYYGRERKKLGEKGLLHLLDEAPKVDLPRRGGILFPHTRLAESGRMTAAAALAVVRSDREEVLALGVLHGAREQDQPLVKAAREGDAGARAFLRGVHGPGVQGDKGYWEEEFSLDNFEALLALAGKREGRKSQRLIKRFPFFVGETPFMLPGIDDLRAIVDRGAAIVATGDLIHHGVGYETPEDRRVARDDRGARVFAEGLIDVALSALSRLDFRAFQGHTLDAKSDFRDAGPVLAALLSDGNGRLRPEVLELELVDYCEALGAQPPTWVAAALAVLQRLA